MHINNLVSFFERLFNRTKQYRRDLAKIRRNLGRIEERERKEYATRVCEWLIAVLHDMTEENNSRKMRNLRIASALKKEYQISADSYVINRLCLFGASLSFRKLPIEGIALTKYLMWNKSYGFRMPRMDDFLQSELTKAQMDEGEYVADAIRFLNPYRWESPYGFVRVPRNTRKDSEFDPFDSTTWKKKGG